MSVNQTGNERNRPGINPIRWLALATVVLLLAAAFRLVALEYIPPGIAQDEVLDADIASFIRGGEHALFFRHGYGHEPLYHYLAAPFAVLYGDNFLAIRLPSVYLGLLLIGLTMRWARRDFGSVAALVAGAGLAVSWWPIVFSRIGIRPILLPVLLVIGVWFWPLREIVTTRRGKLFAIVAGAFLGLSIYSYTAARIILVIPLLIGGFQLAQFVWLKRRDGSDARRLLVPRTQAYYAFVVLVVGLLVYAPLGITLQRNPDLQQRLDQLEGPLAALGQGDPGPVLQMTAATFGVFSFTGDPRWTYSIPDRPLFDPLTAVFFYAGLVIALWRWRRPIYLLLLVWLLVSLLPSALSPDAPSTVRLIGALPVIYLLPGIALSEFWRHLHSRRSLDVRKTGSVLGLAAAAIVLLITINSYRTVKDGFIRWPQELETRLRYQSVLSDIGQHWRDAASSAPPVVAEVFFEPIDAASLRRVVGIDPEARWIQTGAGASGGMVWPTVADEGDSSFVFVPEFAPLHPELINLAGLDAEPDFRSGKQPSFAAYRLPPWPDEEFERTELEATNHSGELLLSMVGLSTIEASDSGLAFASAWAVKNPLPDDLALFVHLVDKNGEIVAQYDGLDVAPSTLQSGDRFIQRHGLPLPSDLEDGEFYIRLGAYTRRQGQRLLFLTNKDVVEIGRCEHDDGLSSPYCRLTDQ
jgi:hypothetical protein